MSLSPIERARRQGEAAATVAGELDRIAYRLRQGAISFETAAEGLRALAFDLDDVNPTRVVRRPVPPCPCECNHGGFCGGCGHAGCGGRR